MYVIPVVLARLEQAQALCFPDAMSKTNWYYVFIIPYLTLLLTIQAYIHSFKVTFLTSDIIVYYLTMLFCFIKSSHILQQTPTGSYLW